MRHFFPGFEHRVTRGEGVVWKGVLSPTGESPGYTIRIQHQMGKVPKVFVDKPQLPSNAIHVYEDRSLCLYWRKEWAWSDNQSLAETVVPWTALWLFFHEIWLETGRWLGPESPHRSVPKRDDQEPSLEGKA